MVLARAVARDRATIYTFNIILRARSVIPLSPPVLLLASIGSPASFSGGFG